MSELHFRVYISPAFQVSKFPSSMFLFTRYSLALTNSSGTPQLLRNSNGTAMELHRSLSSVKLRRARRFLLSHINIWRRSALVQSSRAISTFDSVNFPFCSHPCFGTWHIYLVKYIPSPKGAQPAKLRRMKVNLHYKSFFDNYSRERVAPLIVKNTSLSSFLIVLNINRSLTDFFFRLQRWQCS